MIEEVDENTIDTAKLTKELDKTKATIFLGDEAAFFGSLMCSLTFSWTRSIETAATDGINLWWNPEWFNSLCEDARNTVLQHELWHVARMHAIRRGNRDPKIWNYACDIRINNDIQKQTKRVNAFKGIENCWKDPAYDKFEIMAEEDIYDLLMKGAIPPPPSGSFGAGDGEGDMVPLSKEQEQKVINNVVQAVQQAKLSGGAGTIPGGVEQLISKFLDPVVPWQQVLMQYMTDLLHEDFTWRRPNRRYQDTYLPSRFTDDGRLEHLIYFLDVSGSVSDNDILRFNSEVKYIQEVLNPQKLSLVQFDTKIQKVDEFEADQPFNEIKVTGRGGTSLECVRQYIEKHKPTAAVVFSDMECSPMNPLTIEVPIIWAVLGKHRFSVPFGKVINIV